MLPHEHPAIVAFKTEYDAVNELGSALQGAEFADERGWLSDEEADQMVRDKARWPWALGAMRAHRDRVRLDHPKVWKAWIRSRLKGLKGAARRPWVALRDAAAPSWRLDLTAAEPPDPVPTIWTVRDVATGATLHTFQGGPPRPGDLEIVAVRLDYASIVVGFVDGSERQIALR